MENNLWFCFSHIIYDSNSSQVSGVSHDLSLLRFRENNLAIRASFSMWRSPMSSPHRSAFCIVFCS